VYNAHFSLFSIVFGECLLYTITKFVQTAFDGFADLRTKICIGSSYAEGAHNYGKNGVQVQLQIFAISPVP